MPTNASKYSTSLKVSAPYLWGFAAAAAIDRVLDLQILFLPILILVLVASAGFLAGERAGR